MQENNFEKQMRQKMDGLKLNPSEELWQKVAGGIKKERNNRWLLAIFLLMFISVATGILIMTKQPFGNREDKATALQTRNDSNSVKLVNDVNQKNQTPVTESNPSVSGADAIVKSGTDAVQGQQRSLNTIEVNKKDFAILKIKQDLPDIVGKQNTGIGEDRSVSQKDLQNKKSNQRYKTKPQLNAIIGNGEAVDETVETDETKETVWAKSDEVVGDDKKQVTVPAIDINGKQIAALIEQPKDTLMKNFGGENKTIALSLNKQMKKAPWKIGVNFSIGTSTSQSGVLGIVGIGNGSMEKAFADALQSSPGAGTGSSISYSPSQLKAGMGFISGAYAQKQISPKTNLVIGLNFKRYASSMMIGSRVDSAANFSSNFYNLSRDYYRTGAQQVYRNHFDFIELPLTFRIKLGKQDKLPVYLNTGVSIARLVGSNALQFDVATGAYYSNNGFFNKTHVDMSAGIMLSLFNKSRNPLMAGPVLNFSLNKMAEYGLYKNLHYSYLGLSVQKALGKK